jgi:hypothetical protein
MANPLDLELRLKESMDALPERTRKLLAEALRAPEHEWARRIGETWAMAPDSPGLEWLIDLEIDPALRITVLEFLLRSLRRE